MGVFVMIRGEKEPEARSEAKVPNELFRSF